MDFVKVRFIEDNLMWRLSLIEILSTISPVGFFSRDKKGFQMYQFLRISALDSVRKRRVKGLLVQGST